MNSSSRPSLWEYLFPIDADRLAPSERIRVRIAVLSLCFVLVAITTIAFVNTLHDARTYPGDDLRNRVVGARVMLAGYDSYTFAWQPGMPEELLDPVHEPKAHRLTISPPTLLLYAPVAPLPYPVIRVLSFSCEWLAMMASLALLARSLQDGRHRLLFLFGATLFVIATDIWRLHLERGQVYVFQLLALSAAIAWSRRGQIDSIPAGVALGVLALMRPNLLLFAPALLILRQWRSGGAMLTTVAIGLTATFLMLPTSSWQNYLDVGDQYYRAVDDPGPGPNDRIPPDHVGPVEDVQFGNALTNISCSSFAHFYYVLRTRHGLPQVDPILVNKFILMGMSALLLALIWRRRGDVRSAFALMIVGGLDTEFFLPHRWGYVDVMLLAPLALLLPALLRRENALPTVVVLAGVLSGIVGHQFFDLHAVTVLRSWLVMGGLTALVLRKGDRAAIA